MANLELWEIICTWHGIVHEGACEQLASFAVVYTTLHQSLSNALDQTTVDLAFHNHRVDDGAKVVHCREAV